MAEADDILSRNYGYGDPRWLTPEDMREQPRHANPWAVPPRDPGSIRNPAPRPSDHFADEVAQNISPVAGGMGLWDLGRDVYHKGQQQDWSGLADTAPMAAAAFFGLGKGKGGKYSGVPQPPGLVDGPKPPAKPYYPMDWGTGQYGIFADLPNTYVPKSEVRPVDYADPYLRGQHRFDFSEVPPIAPTPNLESLRGARIHREQVPVFHGTSREFDKFDMERMQHFGIHAGTPGQADIFANSYADNFDRVYPLSLGWPDRPFTSMHVRDHGNWWPNVLALDLEQRGVRFTPEEMDAIHHRTDVREPGEGIIRSALDRHGIDALRYENLMERPGEMSWISWKPGMLWSRTSGDQIYSAAPWAAGAAAIPGTLLDREYGSGQ